MKTNLKKLTAFLSHKENWCKHAYSRGGGHCIIGAIGHLFSGTDESDVKRFLASRLSSFISENKLSVDTGKYDLTLATFNDDSKHETVVEFLKYCEN